MRPVVVKAVSGPGALTNVTALDLGASGACARLSNGQARCWGLNTEGQVGDGTRTTRPRPKPVRNVGNTAALTGVADVAAADQHSCARLADASVVCWGVNTAGQLGTGSTTPARRLTPVVVINSV